MNKNMATKTTPTNNPEPDTQGISDKEQNVDAVVETAAATAAQWIHNPLALQTLSEVTGLAPIFVHLGFLMAHLFQHHATQQGIVVPDITVDQAKVGK